MDYKIKGKKCSEWTVHELRKALKRRKEKTLGKKQELCDRLKNSLKHPIEKSKSTTKNKIYNTPSIKLKPIIKLKPTIKLKPIIINSGEFVFYSTLYYQNPHSTMALEFLAKYGLNKNILNKHKSFQSLWNYLSIIK